MQGLVIMIKKKQLYLLLSVSLFFCPVFGESTMYKKQIWILVHGTFAQEASKIIPQMRWWQPQDDFHKELVTNTQNATIHSFSWCGSNSHEKRIKAGIRLAQFITTVASEKTSIHLIGHSHGANIAILAAQELNKKNTHLEIDSLFCLGTPVSTAYYPIKTSIKKVFNLFSYADFIQPVAGLFQRVYPEEDHIYNLQVKIDGICPNHHSIHSHLIARFLPTLQNVITSTKPQIIHFFSDKKPEITDDATREKDLEFDKNLTNQLITAFGENKKRGHKKLKDISVETKRKLFTFFGL